MAKLLGDNYLLWVESATPTTYGFIKGQGNISESRSADKIDLTDKTSQGYKLSAYSLNDLTLSLEVQPDLPDATGFTRLETLCKALPKAPFNIQIRKGGTLGVTGDVVFQASVYGSVTQGGYPQGGVVPRTFEFGLAAAPTVDQLA